MDTEPSSNQRGVRPGAHRGAIRILLQIVVILTGALGLWLFGVGQESSEPPPEGPAVVSLATAQVHIPSVRIPPPAAGRSTVSRPHDPSLGSGPPDPGTPLDGMPPVDLPDPPVVPEQDAGDETQAEAPDPVVDAPPVLPAASPGESAPQDVGEEDVGMEDAAPQVVAPQVAAPQDARAQEAPVQAGGEALSPAASGEMTSALTTGSTPLTLSSLFASLLPTPVPTPAMPEPAGRWVWPVRGELSQGYSSSHRAIDLLADQGAVIYAADAGTVVYARWESTGYGYLVIIDHHNGFVSYYGHLYGFYIDVGYEVARGEQIGELGTTGRSTGPHLHFEIRQDGVQRDPLDLLP